MAGTLALQTRFAALNDRVVACRACPRLVAWREEAARSKVRRYAGEDYWGRAVPGHGDLRAKVVMVGLAPAAHGANRTGRMFTGDESGRWLYRALHKVGFASRAESVHRDDGLTMNGCYITAAVRCAPPGNRPLPEEFEHCSAFLDEELGLLHHMRVVVGLGKIGFDAASTSLRRIGRIDFSRRPTFGHGVRHDFSGVTLLGSYHPSQQNTFTGTLTEAMLDDVVRTAWKLAGG